MTTVKITQLPAITGANADAADVIPLVDVSLNTTNKITRQEFFNNIPSATVVGDFFIADKIVHNGDTNTSIRFPAADTITMETNGGEKFRITDQGLIAMGSIPVATPNLGLEVPLANETSSRSIGVTSPTYLTDFRATYMTYRGTSATGTSFGLSNAGLGTLVFQNTSAGAIGVNGAVPLVFATTNTERMRITSAGNVGIGTNNPVVPLEIGGQDSLQLRMLTTTNAVDLRLQAFGSINTVIFGTLSNSPLAVFTNNTERMRITAAGNVGIGNTVPVVPLHVTGATMTTGVVYRNQPAQTSIAAAATLTIAQLLTGIIQYTGAAANLTLPTGTDVEGGLPATFPTNMSFDFSIINTGSGTATVVTNTGLTTVGGLTVAAGASGMFRVRKTATNTFTVYRIS